LTENIYMYIYSYLLWFFNSVTQGDVLYKNYLSHSSSFHQSIQKCKKKASNLNNSYSHCIIVDIRVIRITSMAKHPPPWREGWSKYFYILRYYSLLGSSILSVPFFQTPSSISISLTLINQVSYPCRTMKNEG
jgi:hypothetical protein